MMTDNHISIEELGRPLKSEPRVTFDSKDGLLWIRGSYPYPVEASRIEDERDILAWVRHLSRKNWATRALIGEFIDVVAQIKGINTRIEK